MDEWMGRMGGWTDVLMDGQTEGWMDGFLLIPFHAIHTYNKLVPTFIFTYYY